MSKTKWIEKLNEIADEIETQAIETEENDEDADTSSYDDAVSYIRLAVDELRN